MENTSLALTGLWGRSNHWAPNIQSSGARPAKASIDTYNSGRTLIFTVIPVLELTDGTNMATTLKDTLELLEALGNQKVHCHCRGFTGGFSTINADA